MLKKFVLQSHTATWLPNFIALFGSVAYSAQLWVYAHTQTSMVDEGGYLYIGYLFANGTYRPYQDYGPWMYNAPLSYLIPGYVQYWFGPGLRTGRYFAIFLAILMLIALWIIARRWGGKWWAAAIVWAVTLNPIPLRDFSIGVSQGLVACLLAWTLMFVLAEKRSLWQILAGSFLAGVTVMTRHNMLPIIPILIAYVFWQHGKRAGLWSLFASLLPILYFHALYWPNILRIWAMWVPENLAPFLIPFRQPAAMPSHTLVENRLMAFFLGFRFHLIEFVGALAALLLWPRPSSRWKNKANMHAAYFLVVLFFTLALLHADFSLITRNAYTCAYCFTPYITFFGVTALPLIVISFTSWKRKLPLILNMVIVIFILLLSAGLGYATAAETRSWQITGWVMDIRIPHFRRGFNGWFPGSRLGDLLTYMFGHAAALDMVSPVLGLIIGIVLILIAYLLYLVITRWWKAAQCSFGYILLVIVLIGGYILSPVMVGKYREQPECHLDVIRAYEDIGQQLADLIPPGSQVYWSVSNDIPLLYLTNINIYPAQLFAGHSYKIGGDPNQLLKFGLWNDAIGAKWREEADFLVIDGVWLHLHEKDQIIAPGQYEESQISPLNPCDDSTALIVFRKKP